MSAEKNIFAANWKLDASRKQATEWVGAFDPMSTKLFSSKNEIIVAPPLLLLPAVADHILKRGLPIAVAAQEIEPATDDSLKHTGLGHIPALLVDFGATYAILGHSETRLAKGLSGQDVNIRLDLARKHDLKPIVCVANLEQAKLIASHDSDFPGIIAYEPLGNIGTGVAADPKKAAAVCEQIKLLYPNACVIYGGSVSPTNIYSFLTERPISGALIGNKSSAADFFQDIIKNAQKLPRSSTS